MYSVWANSYSKKMYDVSYISNLLNFDFISKFYIYELWLNNYTFLNNYYNITFITYFNASKNNYNKLPFGLYNMFWLFIAYGVNLKIFTVNITSSNQFDINFNTQTLFYFYWNKFNIFSFSINLNKIDSFLNTYIINFTKINFFKTLVTLVNNILNISNNTIYDNAFLSYLYFFSNYMNEVKLPKIINYYLYTDNTSYNSIKNTLNHNYIYSYHLKNTSNIFINIFYKYFNVYNMLIFTGILLLNIYVFNVYRVSIVWYLGIIIFIKTLFIIFFITNILRVSKKIYILIYFFIISYIFNLFLYNELNIESISVVSLGVVLIFMSLILYFYYKYNLFFLIFLELSIISGKSTLYIIKQYCRDFLNILAYLLRIFLLFIRLNIYDGLDDFFDSYYIFIGDFDSYDYLEIIYLFNFNLFPSAYDNIYDKSVLNYEEIEFYLNLIYLYSIILLKFLIFLLLLLEGVFRLLLASYIFILVVLEINNFNVIFIEHKN